MPVAPKVAICQLGIIPGGRLRVILSIVDILNEFNITPDILTTRLAASPADIAANYGRSLRADFRFLPRAPRLSQDFATVIFNAMLARFNSDYDLIINTSNSLAFLPKHQNVITYMFFPRKRRIWADVVSIHQPEKPIERWSRLWFQRLLLRAIYRLSKPHFGHEIVCLSRFTRNALEQAYDIPSNLPVVYPPVDIGAFQTARRDKTRAIVTVGRFGPAKRQLEQILLAEQLSDVPFHIAGFAKNVRYYQQCRQYVENRGITNVHLYPDASFAQMLELLQTSKYFLHTLVNEPFGLTAVQAMAAGCLPIVHDTGGQRETVPEPELRYNELKEVPGILDRLESFDKAGVDSLIHRLQQHIVTNFDAAVFQRKMKTVLAPFLQI